jgi:SAM-dependent methyltransferase
VTSPVSAPPAQPDAAGPGCRLTLERLVGERTVPHLWHENYWFRRHEIAYRALAPRIAAKAARRPGDRPGVVIEAGSGEGYGVELLHRAGADRVVSLDYDGETLAHARAAYPASIGGSALRTNLAALPLATASAVVITSFQVIEHLWTPEEFLAECARVLEPDGLLVLSTPNRCTFSPGLGRTQKPPNPFHAREFDAEELRDLVADRLAVTELLGISHGPRLVEWRTRHGDPVAAQLALPPNQWPRHVADLIRSITANDFVLGAFASDNALSRDEVLDLIVLARPYFRGGR